MCLCSRYNSGLLLSDTDENGRINTEVIKQEEQEQIKQEEQEQAVDDFEKRARYGSHNMATDSSVESGNIIQDIKQEYMVIVVEREET